MTWLQKERRADPNRHLSLLDQMRIGERSTAIECQCQHGYRSIHAGPQLRPTKRLHAPVLKLVSEATAPRPGGKAYHKAEWLALVRLQALHTRVSFWPIDAIMRLSEAELQLLARL